jgi:hypothetical protein
MLPALTPAAPETLMPYQDFRQFLDVLRQQGEPFYEVADVPGWEDFAMPELDAK